MAAQATLTRLVLVRIQAGQPFDARGDNPLAHGLRPAYTNIVHALIAEARRMAPSLSRGTAVVYFLRLRSGIIYVGCSVDVEQRLADHMSAQACRTTAIDPPLTLLRIELCSNFREARHREAQLKRWSRAKEEALIRNDLAALVSLSHSLHNLASAPG